MLVEPAALIGSLRGGFTVRSRLKSGYRGSPTSLQWVSTVIRWWVVFTANYYYSSRQNGTALTTQVPSPPTVQAHSTSQRHGRAHTRDLSRPLTSIATLARTF